MQSLSWRSLAGSPAWWSLLLRSVRRHRSADASRRHVGTCQRAGFAVAPRRRSDQFDRRIITSLRACSIRAGSHSRMSPTAQISQTVRFRPCSAVGTSSAPALPERRRTEDTHPGPRSTRGPVCADLSGLRARENPGRGLRCEHQFDSMWAIPSGPGFEVPDSSTPHPPAPTDRCAVPKEDRCPQPTSSADPRPRSLEAAADALDGLGVARSRHAGRRGPHRRGAAAAASCAARSRWPRRGCWRDGTRSGSGARRAPRPRPRGWRGSSGSRSAWRASGCATAGRCATCRRWRQAWAVGEIDRSHVTTMLGKRTARTEKAFERDHEVLLDAARSVGFIDFKAHCDRWELHRRPRRRRAERRRRPRRP